MHFPLLIWYLAVWCFIHVVSRPQNVFPLDPIYEPMELAWNDVDSFSLDGLIDPSNNPMYPIDFAFESGLTPGEDDIDTYPVNMNDIFFHDYLMDPSPLLSTSACETEDINTWGIDEVPQLEARDGASCAAPEPHAGFDSVVDLFQDPEGSLTREIPPSNVPVGQMNPDDQDGDHFKFDTLLNNRPFPSLFEDDPKICPPHLFGLSNIPVCHDVQSGFGRSKSGFTLLHVDPCMSPCSLNAMAELPHSQGIDFSTIDVITCIKGERLWCCRFILSEVKFASPFWNSPGLLPIVSMDID